MSDARADYLLDPVDLPAQGISTVLVVSPDLQGRLIGRRVPADGFTRAIENGVDVCTCVWAWDIDQSLNLIETNAFALCGLHNGIPDATLKLDLLTLRRAAWLGGVAVCFADPVDVSTGEPLAISPRVILKQQISHYGDLGLVPQAGTELEFYLFLNNQRELRESGFRGLKPTTLLPSDFQIHEGNNYEFFFQKLRADLAASGIEMEAAQSEYGAGQWEMTFAYGDPLEMADRHALYKLAVRDSAQAAGMTATFMAKPQNDQTGSSCHVHFSLVSQRGDRVFWNDMADHNMSETMRSAMAGVLFHAPELMAFYAPTINAYRRSTSADVVGSGLSWGFDNRTTTARVVGHKPQHLRFEFRIPGADTNPYLTLAAILASARDGIEQNMKPTSATVGNGFEQVGDNPLPKNLAEATQLFSQSEFTKKTFGNDNVEHFRILFEHEWKVFMAAVSDWDLHRYFDRI
jgi:glutamine synthetase